MRRYFFTFMAILTGALAGWSVAYINATTSEPVDVDAINARLAKQITIKLAEHPQLRNHPLHVGVELERGLVVLSGLVNSETQHRQVLELSRSVKGSFYVRDQILVRVPREEFTDDQAERQRAAARAAGERLGPALTDAWIHNDLSARLRSDLTTAAQSALQINVVDGRVFLRGVVSTPAQKIAAAQAAADTQGVAEVYNELKTVLESGRPYRVSVG
jgi:osmotically-inducible protein OsmY